MCCADSVLGAQRSRGATLGDGEAIKIGRVSLRTIPDTTSNNTRPSNDCACSCSCSCSRSSPFFSPSTRGRSAAWAHVLSLLWHSTPPASNNVDSTALLPPQSRHPRSTTRQRPARCLTAALHYHYLHYHYHYHDDAFLSETTVIPSYPFLSWAAQVAASGAHFVLHLPYRRKGSIPANLPYSYHLYLPPIPYHPGRLQPTSRCSCLLRLPARIPAPPPHRCLPVVLDIATISASPLLPDHLAGSSKHLPCCPRQRSLSRRPAVICEACISITK